ncbi:MAG: hypothetical protein ACREJC_09980, partial [Tepidisphaeraceae bacterium]
QGALKIWVPIRMKQVGMPHDQWANDGVTLQWDFASQAHITREIATADRFPVSANGMPLWWKVTNAARELT